MVDAQVLVADRYRLIRKLGQGAMGSLWEAEHIALRSVVAIKFIRQALGDNEDAALRFAREARAAAALRSPHVVQILDHGMHGDKPFIAMELLEGETLAERIERQGTLSAEETATVLTHIGRALIRAHEAGIVHRDLKPSNVFVMHNDDELFVKVFDFGIAKTLNPGDSWSGKGTNSGVILGTPYYMSPEQAEGGRPVDASTDIWAMGVLAFECLLGKLPFVDSSLGALVLAICSRPLPIPSHKGAVPEGFDTWFAKACAREPQARFATAKEAAAEFRRLVLGSSAPTTSLPARAPGQLSAVLEQEPSVQVASAQVDAVPAPKTVVEQGGEVALTSTTISLAPPRRSWIGPAALCLALALLGMFLYVRVEPPDTAVDRSPNEARVQANQQALTAPPVIEASSSGIVTAHSVLPQVAQVPTVPVVPTPGSAAAVSEAVPSSDVKPRGSPSARRSLKPPEPPQLTPTPVEKKRRVDLGI